MFWIPFRELSSTILSLGEFFSPHLTRLVYTERMVCRDVRVHAPILAWNEWIGSMVLCNSCDESFA